MNTSSNESSVYSNADIVFITGTTINLVLGVPVNSWVLWLVLTGPAGTMASEFFTLNLSACEILVDLLYLPAAITDNLLLDAFTGGLMFNGRGVFQSCICVERFMAVVHPVLFLKYKPLRYRAACSAAGWSVIVGFSLLYMMLGLSEIFYCLYLGEGVFFMAVMLLCSLAVLRALKQPMPGETSGRERERDNSMKRRAFVIICVAMGSFLGSYLVWCILVIFLIQGYLLDHVVLASYICLTTAMAAGFVHPLLYLCQKTGKLPCVKPVQQQDA